MKNLSFLAIVGVMMLFSAFTVNNAMSWKIADGYSIKFSSDDPTGVFQKMDGNIQFDESDLANSSFDVKVDVSSINTGKGMQNRHAKGKKWFDAKTYPHMRFVSEKFSKTADGYTVSGTMVIKGIEKPFDIPFTFENNVFTASFPVNRIEFGIGKSHKKVPDEIAVEVSVPVTK